MKFNYFLCLFALFYSLSAQHLSSTKDASDTVTIALLLKNRPDLIPLHLACIENQTFAKDKTLLYIYLNDREWPLVPLVKAWIEAVKPLYHTIHVVYGTQDEQKYWSAPESTERFDVWGDVRQRSINWAYKQGSHYFVVENEYFILPPTLESLLQARKPIIAPLLKTSSNAWSNYHASVNAQGYFSDCPAYAAIWNQQLKGIIPVSAVLGVYLVTHNHLLAAGYDDGTGYHDYVRFSTIARKNNLAQHIDNREIYGFITFSTDAHTFEQEPWLIHFRKHASQSTSIHEEVKRLTHVTNKDAAVIFTQIYDEKAWNVNAHGQGTSGRGSTIEATQDYRAMLQKFIKENGIRTVVDLGCGLWEFSPLIDWSGVTYRGLDVVASVIEQNKRSFATEHIQFEQFNALAQPLPEADLLICKDVLQHLTNEDIELLIAQFKKYKYCLINNGIDTFGWLNTDIARGGYRPVDLTKPPFSVEGMYIFTYTVPATQYKNTVLLIINKDLASDALINGQSASAVYAATRAID